MRKYLALRMRARYWAEHGWLLPADRGYLLRSYRALLFGK